MKASLIAMSAVASFFCIVGAPQSHAEQAPACTHPAVVVTRTVAEPDRLLAVIPTARPAASAN